jgi:hypothetical protein
MSARDNPSARESCPLTSLRRTRGLGRFLPEFRSHSRAILWLTPAWPVRRGIHRTSGRAACRVELDGVHPELWGTAYPSREGWYYYEVSHMHGSWLYRSQSEVAADLIRWWSGCARPRGEPLAVSGVRRWPNPDGGERHR